MSEQFVSISNLTEFQRFTAELIPETDLNIEFISIGNYLSVDRKLYECRIKSLNPINRKIKVGDIDRIILVLQEAKKMLDKLEVKDDN